MKLTHMARSLVLVLLLTPAVFAAEDLTGKWSGSFAISMDGGPPNEDTAYMVAKHTGADFGGTIGPNEDQQWAIEKGKVVVATVEGKETTKVTFEVRSEGGMGPTLQFEMEFVAGRLKGKAGASQDGRTMAATVDLGGVK
jgi:hypothetical protein